MHRFSPNEEAKELLGEKKRQIKIGKTVICSYGKQHHFVQTSLQMYQVPLLQKSTS